MRILSFGKLVLPEAGGRDSLPINYRNSILGLQNGAFDYDGQESVLTYGNASRSAIVISNIQSTFQDITKKANKGRLLLRGIEFDNTEYVTFAKISKIGLTPNAKDYDCQESVDINFVQDYPYWLHSADIETFLEDEEVLDDYAWNLDGGNFDSITISATTSTVDTNTSSSITINNTGTSPVRRGYFVLQFQNDYDVNYIKIKNKTNGMQLTYTLDISGTGGTGEWIFDWLSKSLLTDTSDLDRTGLDIPDYQPDWFRLEQGENEIELIMNHDGDTDVSLLIYWSRHYIY